MLVTADGVAATLRFLIPGFVALSIFYWFGLAVRRADWRWLLWSLLASVPLTWIGDWIASLLGVKGSGLATAIATCGADAIRDAEATSHADVSAAIAECATTSAASHNSALSLLFSVIAAVVLAVIAVQLWRLLADKYPSWRSRTQPLAWGVVLRDPQWVMVKVGEEIYVGRTRHVADPVEVEAGDLDLYLEDVYAWSADGLTPLDKVKGMLVTRSEINWMQMLVPEQR